jgi:hypothetical protein
MEFLMMVIGQPNDCGHCNNCSNSFFLNIDTDFLFSSAPDCMCRYRNRMNRTGITIQVNDGIMGVLAAIANVPIGAKQEVKAGRKSMKCTYQYVL